jgi:SAM-dependent methyltransferase
MVQFAQNRYISSPDECWFYHVMDLPEFGTVNHFGSWDLRGRFDDYVSHTALAGKTLLDVGCASGFLTFEAEKRGAAVTSFDVSGGDVVNIDPKTDLAAKRTEVVRMQNGYWLAHRLLNSKAHVVYGDACELARFVDPTDVVLIGQMLVHVRDPLAIIEQACKVAKETIIIAEGSWEADQPLANFIGAQYPGVNAWWHLSSGCYRASLSTFGFDLAKVTKSTYRCNHPIAAGMSEIWTFVANRRNKSL